MTVTENGYGKRTNIGEYRVQSRGGKGLITMKVNDRNGPVVGARLADDEHEVMLVTDHGQIIRVPVEDVSVYGRNTQGVTVMETADDEHVVSMARLAEPEEGEDEEAEGEEAEDVEEDEAADVEGEETAEE